eukprot:1075103-Pleurochrysis_carterae.AAC.1
MEKGAAGVTGRMMAKGMAGELAGQMTGAVTASLHARRDLLFGVGESAGQPLESAGNPVEASAVRRAGVKHALRSHAFAEERRRR